MKISEKQQIHDGMKKIVISAFSQQNLQDDALRFIDYKVTENLTFGQLTILHYTMLGGMKEDIYQVAAAVELLILALDIFDDLQDQDNNKVPWNQMSHAQSMNIATGFLVASEQSLEATSFEEIHKGLARGYFQSLVLTAINGQHTDLLNLIEAEEDYIEATLQKSGSLVALACLIGTSLATTDSKTIEIVESYGKLIGLVAQIANDIEDVQREGEKNDLLHKKITLPILYLLRGFSEEVQEIKDYYSGKVERLEINDHLIEIIRSSGANQYARVLCKVYQGKIENMTSELNINSEDRKKLISYIY